MRVQCDVCAQETAAVLCCADEAALCAACDRRVHRANRLAGKHRRLPLVHPSSAGDAAAPPLCDVCKEQRGLVFCVEDRAILCADCDDPIHSANDLTAKHARFLLVGAKLSAEALDVQEEIPSPGRNSDDSDHVAAAATDTEGSSMGTNGGAAAGGGGSSSISDYLTNICPGWRVEDLLVDAAAVPAKARSDDEQVPFVDADLFDVVAGRPEKGAGAAWAPHVPAPRWGLEEVVPGAMAAPATTAKARQQGHVRERYWSDNDSDAFAVPEISPPPVAKRARPSPSPSPSFWCF